MSKVHHLDGVLYLSDNRKVEYSYCGKYRVASGGVLKRDDRSRACMPRSVLLHLAMTKDVSEVTCVTCLRSREGR
jgi:hypothetical protein